MHELVIDLFFDGLNFNKKMLAETQRWLKIKKKFYRAVPSSILVVIDFLPKKFEVEIWMVAQYSSKY